MPMISGIAHWAKVHKPAIDQFNPDGIYSIDVAIDSKTKKTLNSLGLAPRVKNDEDDRGDYIKIKRNHKKKDGPTNTSVRVVDSTKNPIPDTVLIGNGSKVNVLFDVYDWTYGGKKGVGASLKAVQVIDLVEYKKDTDDLPNVDGGFKTTSTKGATDELDDELPF